MISQMFQCFAEDELKPWFEKPPPDPSAPGENGKAVRVTDNSEATKKKIKEGWHNHAFNHYVCEMISLHRTIADERDQEYVQASFLVRQISFALCFTFSVPVCKFIRLASTEKQMLENYCCSCHDQFEYQLLI